jgi:hypothetical protein
MIVLFIIRHYINKGRRRARPTGSPQRAVSALLAHFRIIRFVMKNQPYQLSLPLSSYPSCLSGKNLIALFMKEQHV